MADEEKKQAPTVRRQTTDPEMGARQARAAAERQKEIEAQKRTTTNPADAKTIDKGEAERFEEAVQDRGTGADPLPQRRIPTDNSLPNSTEQYVVPTEEEVEDLADAADVQTSDVAKAAAKKRAKEDAARRGEGSAATKKYVVQGASIFTDNGKVRPGEVAHLTAAEARSFNKMGRLKPYLDDEGAE